MTVIETEIIDFKEHLEDYALELDRAFRKFIKTVSDDKETVVYGFIDDLMRVELSVEEKEFYCTKFTPPYIYFYLVGTALTSLYTPETSKHIEKVLKEGMHITQVFALYFDHALEVLVADSEKWEQLEGLT